MQWIQKYNWRFTDALSQYIALILPSFLLLLWNGFPIFNPDSASYMLYAFNGEIPFDRSVFYSFWVQWTSLNQSTLYTVVIGQILLMGLVLLKFIQYYIPIRQKIALPIVLFLFGCLIAMPWYNVQIMADYFTPLLFFSVALFIKAESKMAKITLAILIVFCAVTHNAHLVIIGIFSLILLFFRNISIQKRCALLGLVFIAWNIACMSNYRAGYGYTASPSKHVFLMGKLSESGILKKYLEKNCGKYPYKLCAYKDSLPSHGWDFMWSGNPAFEKTGSWHLSKGEYSAIIKGTITDPEFIKLHILESIKSTAKQVTLTWLGDGCNLDSNSNPYQKLKTYFPQHKQAFLYSKQCQSKIPWEMINAWQMYFNLTIVLLGISILIVRRKIPKVLIMAIIFVVINAWTTATLANVISRLNSRTLWIIPFMLMLFVSAEIWTYLKARRTKSK